MLEDRWQHQDEQKVEILLAERATANLIFTQFEHPLKQWQMAVDLKDRSRQRILHEEMEFYAEVQLRNPRLLWYWIDEGGGWVHGADPSTIEWMRHNVFNDPELPLAEEPDSDGILPGFKWGSVAAK